MTQTLNIPRSTIKLIIKKGKNMAQMQLYVEEAVEHINHFLFQVYFEYINQRSNQS